MSAEYDERFDELTGLVKKVIGRVDEMQLEMRDMRKDNSARFNAIDERFDGIDKRFDGVDIRFDGVDKRLDGMDRRFDSMDRRFDQLDKRFDKIEGEIYIGSGRQNDVISKVIELQKTVDQISETQAEQTVKIIELADRLDAVDR